MILERRKFQRSSIFLIVNFRDSKSLQQDSSGITADFSQEGIGIESHSISYERGEILEILLKDPRSELSVSAEGEIVWRRDGWYNCKIGIKFRQITPRTKNEMLALISSVNKILVEPPLHDEDNRRSEVRVTSDGSTIKAAKTDETIYISKIERKITDKDDPIIGGLTLKDKVNKKPSGEKAKAHFKKELRANSDEIIFKKTFINNPQKKNRLLIVLLMVFTVGFLAAAGLKFDYIKKALSFDIQTNKSIISQDIAKRKDVSFNDSAQQGSSGIAGSVKPLQVSNAPEINKASSSGENKRADRITRKGQIANTHNNIQPKGLSVNEGILQVNNLRATIMFDYNSEIINPFVYSEIKKITNALLANPKSIVKIEGYSDNIGPGMYNLDLSMRRSLAVKKMLIQEGIDDARIKVAFWGASNPVASNRTVSGRMKNRRVEMLVVSANN